MPVRRFRHFLAGSLLCALAGCAGVPAAYSASGAPIAASVPAPYTAAALAPSPTGYICFAGVYQCQLAAQVPAGSPCSCPGLGAPSYGIVR